MDVYCCPPSLGAHIVKLGDQRECRISHYGKLDVLLDSRGCVLITLTNMAFVPSMSLNMFSLLVVQAK